MNIIRTGFLLNQGNHNAYEKNNFFLSSILAPVFSMIFFILISTKNADFLLKNILVFTLLLPITRAIFVGGNFIQGLKDKKIIGNLLLTDNKLSTVSLFFLIPVLGEVIFVNFIILFILSLFGVIAFEWTGFFHYFFIYLLSSLTCLAFGVLISICFAWRKGNLLINNTIYYLVIITSGIFSFEKIEFLGYLRILFPLFDFVSLIKTSVSEISFFVLLQAMYKFVIYSFLIYFLSNKMENKVMKGYSLY